MRYFAEGVEAFVVDLLLAAGVVEFHYFHFQWIIEKRYMRVVECQMPILADAEAYNVDRVLAEEFRVPVAFLLWVGSVTVEVGN
ncbi:hypothetical protein D3C87_1979690 [compost metagenome]